MCDVGRRFDQPAGFQVQAFGFRVASSQVSALGEAVDDFTIPRSQDLSAPVERFGGSGPPASQLQGAQIRPRYSESGSTARQICVEDRRGMPVAAYRFGIAAELA